jgi:tRNA(Ile)-lysidine synthase
MKQHIHSMSSIDILDRVAHRYCSLVPHEASVLVAASGGGDSTALLFLLHALSERCAISRLGILHVNHCLRGKESDEDERFVAALAKRLAVPLYVKKVPGMDLHSPGVEAWARAERYRFFLAIQEQMRYDFVATGHTADDQAETVLMRIMRGAGLRGLRGVLARREDGVVRPLIDLRRQEIVSWLKAKNIRFRTDASNDSRAFLRNRIRHDVLPAFERQEPGTYERLSGIAEKSQELWRSVAPAVERWIAAYVKRYPGRFVVKKIGFSDPFHASEGLRSLFDAYAIPADAAAIDRVTGWGARSAQGEWPLPGGAWRFYPGRDTIVFCKETAPFCCTLNVPGVTECPAGARFIVTEAPAPADSVRGDNATVVLDRDVCGDLLVYRNWNAADRFVPFGSARPAAVGTFLAKQRFSKAERTQIGVVENGQGLIVWVPGVRISQAARVTPETKRLLKICYQSCPPIV